MKKRNIVFLITGVLMGLVLAMFLRACSPGRPVKPEIGGQAVPDTHFIIDFNKRYNIGYSQYQGGRIYENVKIVGYTGAKVKESSGRLSESYSFLSHWLVVEEMDGRKVYIPTGGVSFMEEVDQPGK